MDGFQQISSATELTKLLDEIRLKVETIIGQTGDGHAFSFRVRGVDSDLIRTQAVAPLSRILKTGEPIQLLFGMQDGFFLVKTMTREKAGDYDFQLGKEVFRLQRRNNFRVIVPATVKIDYHIKTFRNALVSRPTPIHAIDLSAGGMRLKWPQAGLDKPAVNDHLGGNLQLPGGKTLELFGLVKTLLLMPDGLHVGIAFQNTTLRDEQTLLFACVQLQRETH